MSVSKRSPELEQAFLLSLADNGGHIGKACKAVQISYSSIHDWRENDSEFAKRFDKARLQGGEMLVDEVIRRGLEGVPEPVWYQGEQVGTVQKYSDPLIMFQLKGIFPEKYRERYEHTGANGTPLLPSGMERLEVARRICYLLSSQSEAIDVTPTRIEDHAGQE